MRMLLLLLLWVPALRAQPSLELRLTLVQFAGGRWQAREIEAVTAQAVKILGQCGIAPGTMTSKRVDAGTRFRTFHTPASRELARSLRLEAPAIYFVDDTRQDPAYDAEAIGRGNSRTRPELADTVWIIHAARDPGIALAHEIAHLLLDSGEHSDEPGNLMRDETAPANTLLTEQQCARLRERGKQNGLLAAPR